jgi:hypothetical protein
VFRISVAARNTTAKNNNKHQYLSLSKSGEYPLIFKEPTLISGNRWRSNSHSGVKNPQIRQSGFINTRISPPKISSTYKNEFSEIIMDIRGNKQVRKNDNSR